MQPSDQRIIFMKRYIPDRKPKPQEWLALSEEMRVTLVEKAHIGIALEPAAFSIHAALHVIVENQLAMDVPEVAEAFGRLRKEGLDRHDSIHAIASVLVDYTYEKEDADGSSYFAALQHLTAENWVKRFADFLEDESNH